MDKLSIEWVPRSRLFCSPSNPRRNDDAVPHVAASIRRFGFRQPIVARPSGEVIAGNTRLKAAESLGLDEVPVAWFEGSDLEATAYAIADNRTHEFSAWNEASLAELLQQLRAEDGLDGVGYSDADIDELLAQLEDEAGPAELDDPGPGEAPSVAVSRPGDIWHLGEHRLLCGDSTKPADVHRVMAGEKAKLVATDPPYLVDYTGERPNDSGKDWTATYHEIDIKDADGFFRALFINVLDVLAPYGAIYCWHAHKRSGLIQRVWADLSIVDHQQIVWVKPASVFGRVYWHFRHEPCVMGWRQGQQPPHDGHHEHDSVWEVDWEGKARLQSDHPCLHPDSLVLTEAGWRPIRSIEVGEKVYAADGQYHAVTAVSAHRYTSPDLFRIVAWGSSVATLASDNHPFLIWQPRLRGGWLESEVAWVRADELREGACTMTPLPPVNDDEPAARAYPCVVEHEGVEYWLRTIERIDRVPYEGDVWNLSVEGCPSFQTSVGMSHNTSKPVELFARPMRKHTKPGDVVFEPFSGSGSQLIAAERERRRCRAIELEPAFVDVAIRRWEEATGKSATLEGDGRTFTEVAEERAAAPVRPDGRVAGPEGAASLAAEPSP